MGTFKHYMNESNSLYKINEGADMLDISIKHIDKVLKKDKDIELFLKDDVIVEEGLDGVKISLIRLDTKFDSSDFTKNWVVGYKGNILYPEEYYNLDNAAIKKSSIGSYQFKFIFDHLNKIHFSTKNIPTNTELFIEFLINKPTIGRNYKYKHGLILIAHSKSEYKINNGKLRTKPTGFFQDKLEEYAKILKLEMPPLLFKGRLYPEQEFLKGIKSPLLEEAYQKHFLNVDINDVKLYLASIKNIFLDVQSRYGNEIEKAVFKSKKFGFLKFSQEDQTGTLGKELRDKNKFEYKMDIEDENKYWNEIKEIALNIVSKLNLGKQLNELLKDINIYIQRMTEDEFPYHSKLTLIQKQEGLLLTTKNIVIRKLPGNNNALMLGRFQPLTLGHEKMIDTAYKECDNVWVSLIKGNKSEVDKNPFPIELQEEMLRLVYPNINIITASTGNILTIINKIEDNINVIYAGTDRVDSYNSQLSRLPDVEVREIKRTDEDISATKVRTAIINNDINAFKSMVNPKSHHLFDKYRKILVASERLQVKTFKEFHNTYKG
jgi:nicotinamide mononucleotide adenylyltransferase